MIKRILVPLDGSKRAEAVLPYAVTLHRAFGAQVVLFRVVGIHSDRPGSEGWRLAQAKGWSYLEQVARRLGELGVEPTVDVSSGDPAEEIGVAIRRWKTNLVILFCDRGETEVFPCDNIASKVIASAEASFLLVRGSGSLALDGVPIRRVVVPVDGSRRGDWALKLAAALADTNGAELLLGHVVARPEFLQGNGAEGDLERLVGELSDEVQKCMVEANRLAALRFLDDKRRQLASPDLEVETQVAVAASVPRAIQALASRREGSLVVLSAHGQSAESGLSEGSARSGWAYGGVATSLLFQSSGPLLVLQDLPRSWSARSSRTARYARATQGGTEPHIGTSDTERGR